MKLERSRHRQRGEPIIALINVVFLILIFVMITTVIEPLAPLDVYLPDGETDVADSEETRILIDADGNLAQDDQAVDIDALVAWLNDHGTDRVTIHADADLGTGTLFDIVTRLRASGVIHVGLATAKP